MMRRFLLPGFFALCALPATAQLGSTVGPTTAPVGCPIQISISNDTTSVHGTGVCPFRVIDAGGGIVAPGACIEILQLLMPGDTLVATWDQNDSMGNPVAPGTYQIEVDMPDGTVQTHTVTIDPNTDAAIAPMGVTKIGETRGLALCSTVGANQTYLAAASTSIGTGIPTCAGTFPLDLTGLFLASVDTSSPVFQGFVGVLDGAGTSTAPAIAVPDDPSIVGATFYTGFITLDATQPCPVTSMSDALALTIQ